MNCPKCGAAVGPNTAFCLACGAKVNQPQPAQPQAAVQQPAVQRPAAVPPAAAPPQYAPPRDPFAPQPGMGNAGNAAPPHPQQPAFFDDDLAPIISTRNWFGTMLLLLLVPLVVGIVAAVVSSLVDNSLLHTVLSLLAGFSGLIMILIFAFGKGINPSKRNFFRAWLLLALIMLVLVVVLILVAGALLAPMLAELDMDSLELMLQGLD